MTFRMKIRICSSCSSSPLSLIQLWYSRSYLAPVILILCFLSRLSAEESPVHSEFDCRFNDSAGNVIDLSKLSHPDGSAWEVHDTRPGHSDLFYDLHLCRRFRNYTGAPCNGVASSCQRIVGKDNAVTYKSLGLPEGPPVRYADNSVRLFYSNGTFCHKGQNHRRTSIEFLCDPNSNEQEGPVFVDETSACTYKFIWRTKFVCPPSYASAVPCVLHDTTKKLTYDLSGLRRSDRNWVTPVTDGSNRTVHINFCDSLVSLPAGAKTDCAQSGACLIKNDENGTVTTAVSLGKPQSPEFENDGSGITFHYSSTTNSSSTSCGMSMRVLCSRSEEASREPVFLWQFGCLSFMMLSSPHACARTTTTEVVRDDCSVKLHGELIDLSRMRNEGGYSVRTADYDYSLNVCGPVKCDVESGTVAFSGGCQSERNGHQRNFSMGQVSQTLKRLPGDVLELKYDSGSPCRNGAFNRTTIIYFFCDNHISVEKSKPVFIDENDECNYEFHWRTPLACRESKRLECAVDVPSPTKFDVHHVGNVDLKKLALAEGSHDGFGHKIHLLSQFAINVCRPVHSTPNMKCAPGSGICMPAIWQQTPQNLGYPDSEPEFIQTKAATVDTPAEGYISLRYSNGDACVVPGASKSNASEPKRLSSEIRFVCSPGSDVGSPRLVNDDQIGCHYVFEWVTNTACPPDAEVNEKTCSVHFADADYTFDLTQYPKPNNEPDFHANHTFSQSVVHWNICGPVGHLNESDVCADAAVCAVRPDGSHVSYGSADNMRLRRDENAIRLQYSNGSDCKEHWLSKGMGNKAYSHIQLECDHKETRTDLYLLTSCYAILHHRSPFFCPPVTEKCYLTYESKFYDLRSLSAQDGEPWEVAGKDVSYRLNVCGNIFGVGGCNSESAVCTLPKEGSAVGPVSEWSNSPASNQRLEMIRPNNETAFLQLTYFGAQTCLNRTKNGGFYVTKIRFECGAHLGKPVLVKENREECELVFSWKSKVACSVEKAEVHADENGIIQDPVTERRMNVSALLHPEKDIVLTVDERNRGDRYVYFIRLGSPIQFDIGAKHDHWRNCINASICQTGPDGTFFRDIGTNGRMQLFLEDGQLEAILEGGKCGRVPTRNVKSHVRFHCDPMEHMPEFLYESKSCDYVFSWKTPQVCLRDLSGATLPFSIVTDSPTPTKDARESTSAAIPSINTAIPASDAPVSTQNNSVVTDLITARPFIRDGTSQPAVASTAAAPGLPGGNGSDTAAKGGRSKAVNHTIGAIVAIIVIAIVMFIIFYAASPRFRGKVSQLGQRMRRHRSGSPLFDRSPQRGFEPINDDSFVYDATDMNVKGKRSLAYGAQSTTPPRSLSEDPFGPDFNSVNANGFNDQTERDDAYLVT